MAEVKLDIGSTISHFRLEKKLGEGGMGAVFLAEDLTLSRRVAIKFMTQANIGQQGANQSLNDNLSQRFIREARSAAAINHPNVCQIYEANFESSTWYIAMELIHGNSLAELLAERKQFPVGEIVQIVVQVASGLKFAWDHFKIVHRDIKLQNIMLTKENQVKIVDLGLAKPTAAADEAYEMPELTGAGVPVGTPQYMAPEQAAGEPGIDQRADIFAIGASIYELLTGQKAFQEKTAPMIYIAQMKKGYKPIRDLRPDAPPDLIALVDKMLEPNRNNRVSDYGEVLHALGLIGAQLGVSMAGATQFVSTSGTIPIDLVRSSRDPDLYPVDSMILDRYKVIKHLGKSRAGIVYLCIDDETKTDCAVKSLKPGREFPAERMPTILTNLRRLQGMEHPNLVRIFDLHEARDGEILVVMELLRGQNLRQYTHHEITRYGQLDIAKIEPVVKRIAAALDAVADKFKLGHGDLKPESIYLVDNDTRVVLLDYGVTEDPGAGRIVDSGHVRTPLPSPDYMAPELWRGEPLSRACDQYSLAVCAYEMLARRLPFWLKDAAVSTTRLGVSELASEQKLLTAMAQRVLNEEPPRPDGIGEREWAVFARALAKTAGQRYESPAAFAKALGASGKGTASKKGLLIGIAAGFAVVIAALIVVILKVLGSGGPAPAPSPPGGSDTVVEAPVAPPVAPDPTPSPPAGPTREAVQALLAPVEALKTAIAFDSLPEDAKRDTAALEARTAAAVGGTDLVEAESLARQLLAKLEELRLLRQNELGTRLAEVRRRQEELAARPHAEAGLAALAETFRAAGEAAAANNVPAALDALAKLETGLDQLAKDSLARAIAEAETSMRACQQQLATLDGNAQVAGQLAPVLKLRDEAQAALAQADYAGAAQAAALLRQALEQLAAVSQQAAELARENAAQLRADGQEARRRINQFAGLDADIDSLLNKIDQALDLAADSMARKEYGKAVTHFERVRELAGQADLRLASFKPAPGKDFTALGFRMEMVWVEKLGLWVGRHEVTNKQYRILDPAHISRVPEHVANKGYRATMMNGDQQPAAWVTHSRAEAYCELMNGKLRELKLLPDGFEFRLPTGDEWKTVATAGQERKYVWGNAWPPAYGNFGNFEVFGKEWQLDGYEDEFPLTCDVEKSGRNDWGIFGMAGNVWEWSTDVHSQDQQKRAVYGASWEECSPAALEVNLRGFNYALRDESYENIGFRVFLAPVKPAP